MKYQVGEIVRVITDKEGFFCDSCKDQYVVIVNNDTRQEDGDHWHTTKPLDEYELSETGLMYLDDNEFLHFLGNELEPARKTRLDLI